MVRRFLVILHTSRSQSERGQALPFMTIMVMILLLCWMMIINVGRLMSERMMMQNAADNAAISAAIHQARTMNMVNRINQMIAKVFYDAIPIGPTIGMGAMHPLAVMGAGGGTYGVCGLVPIVPQLFQNDVTKIAATIDVIPLGMTKCSMGTGNGSAELKTGIQLLKSLVDGLIPIQEAIAQAGPLYSAIIAREVAWKQAYDAEGNTCGADTGLADVIITSLGLGLERNDTKITYYSAKHTYISVPPIPIFLPPGLHVHIVTPVEYKKTEKSWYYVKDETKFSKKKITVTAVKRSGSASNAGYPFGKGLFKGIKDWPEIRTIAAAAYYNTKGPGFRIAKETKIKETIEAFDDSERSGNRGGWKAHLVPAGLGTRH